MTIFCESYMILMRFGYQKTTINNKVRAIKQMFVLNPAN